jgi:hypothetical protein
MLKLKQNKIKLKSFIYHCFRKMENNLIIPVDGDKSFCLKSFNFNWNIILIFDFF